MHPIIASGYSTWTRHVDKELIFILFKLDALLVLISEYTQYSCNDIRVNPLIIHAVIHYNILSYTVTGVYHADVHIVHKN
jgi:hypothetical protein